TGTVAERLAVLLDRPVRRAARAGSRHDWEIHYAELDDGERLFVKPMSRGTSAHGALTAEARRLDWLGQAPGSPARSPLAVAAQIPVLPWGAAQDPTPAAAEGFGRILAGLHLAGAGRCCAPWPAYIGPPPLDSSPSVVWPSFYAEQRLRSSRLRALE